jgi:hypothetical protein
MMFFCISLKVNCCGTCVIRFEYYILKFERIHSRFLIFSQNLVVEIAAQITFCFSYK